MRTIALLALTACCLANSALAADDDPRHRKATTSDIVLAPPGEPGERFELEGRVLARSGNGLPGVRIYAYHADAHGLYGKRYPRLAGVLRTDASGHFRLRTVFPGSYGGYAAHVHFEVLDKPYGGSFVNVFGEGSPKSPGPYTVAKRDRAGVWHAHWDLIPGAAEKAGGMTGLDALRSRLGQVPALRGDDPWAPPLRRGTGRDSVNRSPADTAR